MLSTILFAAAIVCGAAALYWYFASAMQIASNINAGDALNDPLMKECRAEMDDHTYLLGHTPPKELGAR
jgi:hypothetical protein